MIRTAIARTGVLKPARTRKCAVKGCATRFQPRSITHKVCGPACAEVHAAAERKRLDAKQTRERKQALKTRADYLKEAQVAFNAFIRARDAALPCICCGRTSEKQYLTGSNWDCGHYRSTGSAPHLRFNEDNAHRQLTVCNRHGAGRAVDYRIGLIQRIGLARVEALEADQAPRKWTPEQLIEIRDTYRAKLRELKEKA
ncbi:recombination protein NinG [Massilia sp. ZL223]|uniref:recombination protein NinG n=1 Tax=Massilia sp. ZL223 TaxID=2824904 RepID=UPI001B8333B7|nr:recombination protein NinG [Massilia sp. ZL223]MBQ5963164.1 recombination protein NinG [Massilia sp. ZL223]